MDELIGTWRLVEWTASVDGHQHAPFGGHATGLLTYTADGRMWAALMREGRHPLSVGSLAAAPASERAHAAAGYLNYGGTYRVENGRVFHDVEVSLMPNWVGTVQARNVEWRPNPAGGRDLVLATTPAPGRGGRIISNTLRWRRLEDWG